MLLGSIYVYPASAQGGALRAGFNSSSLARNDDGSVGPVAIGFTVNFYGQNFNQLYVNNNGNVTFDSALGVYTPFNLYTTGRRIIAPFFSDVDTRGEGSNVVTYGIGTVNGRRAFGVNWVGVGYYRSKTDKLNSFQLVLIDRSDIGPGDFDFEFNYGTIRWETGDASGGSGGLGGSPARAGYSNGTSQPGASYEIAGSGVSGALLDSSGNGLVQRSLNNSQVGRFLFAVRNGTVPTVVVTLLPAPANINYLISATPTMPQIKASAKVTGVTPDPTATTTFTWTATLTTPNGSGTPVNISSSVKPVNLQTNTNTTTGTQSITLTVNPAGVMRGGKLKLTAKATVDGQTVEGHTPPDLAIIGKNPGPANVRSFIDTQVTVGYQGITVTTLRDTLKRMACHESGGVNIGQSQFRATPNGGEGPPIVARDNGVGIFQITTTNKCPAGVFASTAASICRDVIFSWKANVTEGVRVFKAEKIAGVKVYPQQLRNGTTFANFIATTINPARVAAGKPPLPTVLPLTFVPEYTTQQLLYDAIRYYNGFGTRRLYGYLMHEYRPNVTNLKTKTLAELQNPGIFWQRVPGTAAERTGSPEPDYVNKVLATPPTCSAAGLYQVFMVDQGPAPIMSTKLGTDTVELKFAAPLDPVQAVDASRYVVRHNLSQAQIKEVTYDYETHIVSLVLDRPVREWDELIISWDLIDLYANPLKGERQEVMGVRSKEEK